MKWLDFSEIVLQGILIVGSSVPWCCHVCNVCIGIYVYFFAQSNKTENNNTLRRLYPSLDTDTNYFINSFRLYQNWLNSRFLVTTKIYVKTKIVPNHISLTRDVTDAWRLERSSYSCNSSGHFYLEFWQVLQTVRAVSQIPQLWSDFWPRRSSEVVTAQHWIIVIIGLRWTQQSWGHIVAFCCVVLCNTIVIYNDVC